MSKVERVHDDLDELLERTFINESRPGYGWYQDVFMATTWENISEAVENFQVRDDDIWICTFPKAGTTWTQEMVWCIANDLDFEGAKTLLSERSPFFDLSSLFDFSYKKKSVNPKFWKMMQHSVDYVNELPSPRYIKTHLPFNLLPRMLREGKTNAKMIYVSRNPKDLCISFYYHCRNVEGYTGNFEEFTRLFCGDRIPYCPFWHHIRSYCERADELKDRILFIKYEDMKRDLPSIINKTTEFLSKPKLSSKDMNLLVDHLSFDKMKENPAVNHKNHVRKGETEGGEESAFMRCGKMDQWKYAMTPDIIKKLDEWIQKNVEDCPALPNFIHI